MKDGERVDGGPLHGSRRNWAKPRTQSQRTRLRRRVATYRSKWWVQMLDCNFIAIFSKTQMELDLPGYDIDEIINKASDAQIDRMNYELDELQSDR